MEVKKLGQIVRGQDGVVFCGFLFRFDINGDCFVYKTSALSNDSTLFSKFRLDKSKLIAPHSNAVVFSGVRYDDADEFPLLYANVYNNYANCEDKQKGVVCVYRLQRCDDVFSTTLVQIIEIGFVEDGLWKSENVADVRPYGNFVIDPKNSILYAFTMRDEERKTRYFSFKLPSVDSGEVDDRYGVKRAVLEKGDVVDYFDCEYHRFIQGACFNGGIIYSLEGFGDEINRPALRLIDTAAKEQTAVYYFSDFGLNIEPEFIDFEGQVCYYADNHGNVYQLAF